MVSFKEFTKTSTSNLSALQKGLEAAPKAPQPLTPQPSVQATIQWLQSLGLPPLPVAPAQDPYDYPKIVKEDAQKKIYAHCPLKEDGTPIPLYTGKNPSYLDKAKKPHLVMHRSYQERSPSYKEIKEWFANPANGIGTLGSEEFIWIDFDVKNFSDASECREAAIAVAKKIQEISGLQPTLEETHSGGWRVLALVSEKPTFTNFALEPGGKHVGEALGFGRFTVLAPTIGPSGNSYTAYHRHDPDKKPKVQTLEIIGVYQTGKNKNKAPTLNIPAPTPMQTPTKSVSSTAALSDIRTSKPTKVSRGSVALSNLGTAESRDVLAGNNIKNDRSASLTLAIREWYGWENWCAENGKAFTEDAESLAYEAGAKLGIDADRIERILKTINSTECLPALISRNGDALRHYERKASGRNFSGGIGSGSGGSGGNGGNRRGAGGTGGNGGDGGDGNGNGKIVKFPGFEPYSLEEVCGEIDELINKGTSGSALTGQLNRLAAESQIHVVELRKIYYERLGESDLEIERGSNQGEIEKLLNLSDASLELNDYLPPELAEPITRWCEWMSVRPAVAFTSLLAGVSSLHKVGTQVVLQRNQNFVVPPTLYAAIVSPSGQKKTPVFSNFLSSPLNELSDEKEDGYNAAMADYETAMKIWEQIGAQLGEPKPEKPKDPTLYYFTNATGEAIPIQAAKDPSKGMLALIDELSGLLNSANSYRGGRGSDKQDLLSYFDGKGQTVIRAGGVKAKLKNLYLSIFGTIQPEVLKRHMEDCSDPDGQWARFLFVNQPLEASTLSDDNGGAVQIYELIADFYRQIERIPEMKYRLSRAAFKRYQPVYNELERLRVTHQKSGMRAVYSKMEGYIGRLALNLHVLWELASGKACPDEEIPLYIMEMAIQLAKFYIGQVKLIHAHSDDESLPTHIVKLIEFSKRLDTNGKNGWIKAQAYREQFASKKRPSAQQARDWMNEAVALGYGRTRGSGNRLEFHWQQGDDTDKIPPSPPPSPPPSLEANLGKLREDLGKNLPYGESIETKGFEANLGKLGKGIPELTPPPTVVETAHQIPLKRGDDTPPTCGNTLLPNFTENDEEGGSVPCPSLTVPQESFTPECVDVPDLGENLGNPFPNSSLTSLSEEEEEDPTAVNPPPYYELGDEEAIAEAVDTLKFQLERDAIVDWQEVINLMNAYEFNENQKTEVKRRLEAWNPAMLRDTYERTKRIEAEAAVEEPVEAEPTVEEAFEALIEEFGGKSHLIEIDDVPYESPHMAEDIGTHPEVEPAIEEPDEPEEELDFDPYEDITELVVLSGYQEPESYVGRLLIARKDRYKVPAGTIVEVVDQSEEYLCTTGVTVEWGEIDNGYWEFVKT
jgi:hypothetical protein